MDETIFDRILAGDIPCHTVYEDEFVLAFLDIGPLSEGHTLVIPKERAAFLHELSDESAAAIGRVLPRICRAVMQATGCSDYNLLQNNGMRAHQEVMHVHFHIIPKPPTPGRPTPGNESGLGISWPAGSLSGEKAGELVGKMREFLE